jgi:hypothetical protein
MVYEWKVQEVHARIVVTAPSSRGERDGGVGWPAIACGAMWLLAATPLPSLRALRRSVTILSNTARGRTSDLNGEGKGADANHAGVWLLVGWDPECDYQPSNPPPAAANPSKLPIATGCPC